MQPADLITRLRHPDAAIRLDTLRILAMLEETEALDMVAQVYKHDPDPNVRRAAGWAGKILYQAHQRGHSTAQAIAALDAAQLSTETEELILAGAASRLAGEGKAMQAQMDLEQLRLQHELLDTMQENVDKATGKSLTDLAADILDKPGTPDRGQAGEV